MEREGGSKNLSNTGWMTLCTSCTFSLKSLSRLRSSGDSLCIYILELTFCS